MMVKPKMIFGLSQENFIYRHHVEPSVKLYVPKEESFTMPLEFIWRYQNYLHNVGLYVGEKYLRLLERWWRSWIVRYVDWFQKIHDIEWKSTKWTYMVWVETDKKTNDHKARQIMARNVEIFSDASKRKEKQKWTIEKPKLDNARRLRGIYFIDPEDEEFKLKMNKCS